MRLVQKILRADECRRTRLHDEKGNLVPLKRLLWNGSRAYTTALLRLTLGIRPAAPWISYDAARVVEAFLTPQSRVLEFGSGMSTVWFARHAGSVHSVENFRPWYEKVRALLTVCEIQNVTYRFASTPKEYVSAGQANGATYDLILVDGDYRSECVRQSINYLNRPGILYLDNSDKDSGPQGGDLRAAEALALEFAERAQARVQFFTDFAPAQMTPNQGLMISLL